MKKLSIIFTLAVLVCASVAMAQNPQYANPIGGVTGGIQGIDKLGAHQNGGRGCVGCHTPHSGSRGNGGSLTLNSSYNGTTKTWSAMADPGTEDRGDVALWGQDIGPIIGLSSITSAGGYVADFTTLSERMETGVVFCLSCHDGNVAKGAMMTNVSFEQTAGLLPPSYGSNNIPTLLGDDGGSAGNYTNDHPIGAAANIGALPIKDYFTADATTMKLTLVTGAGGTTPFAGGAYQKFVDNYGMPTTGGARGGSGFAVESADANAAYVVCTTCHTPHSMYTASASSSNRIATLTSGTFPSYFFIAAPYNPGANVANGTKASSATQFCRQCHFKSAGGSNEGSGISIPTAF